MPTRRLLVLGCLIFLCFSAGVQAQPYDLPFKGQDFDDGRKVFWGRAKHSANIQEWGYDLGALRYDSDAKKWTDKTISDEDYNKLRKVNAGKDSSSVNKAWAIYGKNIYAMRAGKVIACWRNAPENPNPPDKHGKVGTDRSPASWVYGGGNGFWIEHDDGTRAEYAHMIPGSVPSSLCPHNASLMPVQIASTDVRHAWPHIGVTGADQVPIKQGQFLGRVGNTGTSSAPHLHVHVEKGGTAAATKSGGTAVDFNFRRGMSAALDNSDSDPPWKSFAGKRIPAGPVLVWPPRSLSSEFSRHGFAASKFQSWFDHLSDSGFWLTFIDTYSVGGKNYVNHVWRPAKAAWRSHVLVDAAAHQKNTDDAAAAGFGPTFVESSVSGGKPRYSAVFVKGASGNVIMRHGLPYLLHQGELASAKAKKLSPVNISVVSISGQKNYTVLYRPESVGAWEIKSEIPEMVYQVIYNENKAAGRLPIYLNSYMHGGNPFISAVFASKTPTGSNRKDRHLMSPDEYQNEYSAATKSGKLTRAVTSFDGAQSAHRFAAAWWK